MALFHFLDIEVLNSKLKRYEQQNLESNYILLVTKGEVNVTKDDKQYYLTKNSMYICSKQKHLALQIDLENVVTAYLIRFDMHEKEQNIIPVKEAGEKIYLAQTGEIIELCNRLVWLSKSPIKEDQLLGQANFYMLLHAIVKNRISSDKNLLGMLEKTKQHIQYHFHESIQVKDLAQMMNISSKYYMELFRKQFGLSATQYLTKVRIEASKWLLIKENKTLREIASEVGYKDEFYFSRRFKQEVGVSPSLFMKSRRKNIVVLDSSFFGLLAPLHYIPVAAPLHPTWRFYYYKEFGNHVVTHLVVGRTPPILNENIMLLQRKNIQYDLILCLDNINEEQLTSLQKLGHVYQLAWTRLSWREQLLEVARLLDAENEANNWLIEYEQAVQKAVACLETTYHEQTFLFLLVMGNKCYQYQDRSIQEVLLGDLGLRLANTLTGGEKQSVTVGQLAKINPDVIMVLVYEDEESMQTWSELQVDETWLELKSVRNRNVYRLTHFPWRDYAPLPHYLMVKEIEKRLTSKSSS